MPAPGPITPSPHRFVTNTSHPPPHLPPALLPQPCTPQFARTPRFSFASHGSAHGSHHRPILLQASSSPQLPWRLLHGSRPSRPTQEEIETGRSELEDEEGKKQEHGHSDDFGTSAPVKNIRHKSIPPASPVHEQHKRRRINPETIILPSSLTPLSPQITHEETPSTQHHFTTASLVPHFATAATTTTTTAPRFLVHDHPLAPRPPSPTLPKFILPNPPSSQPQTLSPPTRLTQKFLPGGLASTLRTQILSTSLLQTQSQTQATSRSNNHSIGVNTGWEFRVLVKEYKVAGVGAGIVLVQGEEGKRWVLVGDAGGVRAGCTVGVRRPTWEVEVEGERWGVGVEWAVLVS